MTDGTPQIESPRSGLDGLPYKIAALCYLYDEAGRVLMLHRNKMPNQGLYSPIGGKLETGLGESPHECAVREIAEESGVVISRDELRLLGIVSETAYAGHDHWLIFLFRVMRPIRHDELPTMTIDEGTLEWVAPDDVPDLGIPETDREVMWPLIDQHRDGFFSVHIDCSGPERITFLDESWPQTGSAE